MLLICTGINCQCFMSFFVCECMHAHLVVCDSIDYNQTPLSMEFSRQEYLSRLSFPFFFLFFLVIFLFLCVCMLTIFLVNLYITASH